MNILTFDIEDWYNCDVITSNLDWDKFEVRIYKGVEKILEELENRDLKATFFCLGWIAERHPDVIKWIHSGGHQIGCHSYNHELVSRFDREGFKLDTKKAKNAIEDLIGESINLYRAPAFSINKTNIWILEILAEMNFEFDCSILPASHDYGGFPDFGAAEPVIIQLPNGSHLKEFPINVKNILGKKIVFSGGGFFRFFPYRLIKHWVKNSQYMITYFHSRDFDPGQPILDTLPPLRKYKSYVGLTHSFYKFQKLLNDFEFINIKEANEIINWQNVRVINL